MNSQIELFKKKFLSPSLAWVFTLATPSLSPSPSPKGMGIGLFLPLPLPQRGWGWGWGKRKAEAETKKLNKEVVSLEVKFFVINEKIFLIAYITKSIFSTFINKYFLFLIHVVF